MSVRLGVVGLGQHGARIARAALDAGHVLVAAADPSFAGAPVASRVSHPRAPATAVLPSSDDLRDGPRIEMVVVTAAVDLGELARISGPFLRAGVDVLTINSDAFDPPDGWAADLDAQARAGGSRFLATGVQDLWWVHLPALAAASLRDLRRVAVDHELDVNTLAAGFGETHGVGQPPWRFAAVRDGVLSAEEPVLGGALRILARRLGLRPGPTARSFEPRIADRPTTWRSAATEIPAGRLIGYSERTVVPTAEGVELRGTLTSVLMGEGREPRDAVRLEGDPVLHLEHRPFPGERITDVVPVARIEDLRAAAPGLHTAASLPAPRYRHPAPDR